MTKAGRCAAGAAVLMTGLGFTAAAFAQPYVPSGRLDRARVNVLSAADVGTIHDAAMRAPA